MFKQNPSILVFIFRVNVDAPLSSTDVKFLFNHRREAKFVKAVDSQSRGPVFKTTGWFQGRLSISSFRGR